MSDAAAAALSAAAVPKMVQADAPLTAPALLATAAGAVTLMVDMATLKRAQRIAQMNVFSSSASLFLVMLKNADAGR